MARLRVLGVDPGSVTMGVGVIDFERGAARFVHLESLSLKSAGSFTARLGAIFGLIDDVIALHQPDEFAIEQIFMYRSPESSLKLAQARGAAIAAAVRRGLPVHEYMPAVVKQAVVGTGRADKLQVQHMVKRLLSLQVDPPADGADAAAVALCHCYRRTSLASVLSEAPGAEKTAMQLLAQSRYRRRSR
ncbi:MAG TPA: crossover junction endodeoxyribonuclease RuvC [Halothiobacillus sp.]|nr:crossover junction endodeoxyribonuclease RuvC [Halothiobacillus sp.]